MPIIAVHLRETLETPLARRSSGGWNCDIDIEHCPQCGGQLKLIAAIDEPTVIQRILTHLGLAAPPPRMPARRVDLLQAK